MLRLLICFIVVALSSPAFAEDDGFAEPPFSPEKVNTLVTEAVQAYAKALGCTENEAVTVIPLIPYKGFEDRDDALYGALWTGDIECQGGSGSERTHFSLVRVGAAGYFFVDVRKSSPLADFPTETRYVDKVLSHTRDTITLQGAGHGENDPSCCPSLTIRYTLKLESSGNWRMTHKEEVTK